MSPDPQSRVLRLRRGLGNRNVVWGALLGALLTVAFHLGIVQVLLEGNDLWQRKFIGQDLGSSWIPIATVFFGFWGAGILAFKLFSIRRSRRALDLVRGLIAGTESTVTGVPLSAV